MTIHSLMPRPVTTKERIERAALRLFVEQGIAETSIKKIAQAAGVSQGAMYNHYVSKEELAWALFSRNFSEIGQELRQCAREQDGLEARLSAMIRLLFRRFDEDWLAVTYAVFVRHQHIRRVDRRQGNPYLVFRTVIAEAIKSGEIPRQDAELSTALVTGAIIQVMDTRILGRLGSDLQRLADEVGRRCVRLLGGGTQVARRASPRATSGSIIA
jgi:AcrR family transcriptional regulator